MDSRGGYVSKILYVEMKGSGPLGGVCRARPLDPPMQGIALCAMMSFAYLDPQIS